MRVRDWSETPALGRKVNVLRHSGAGGRGEDEAEGKRERRKERPAVGVKEVEKARLELLKLEAGESCGARNLVYRGDEKKNGDMKGDGRTYK